MRTTRRQRILEAIKGRLEAICRSNGYETDLGANVLLGEFPTFGPDDPEQVIAILIGEDQIGEHLSNIPITLPINIAAIVKPDVAEPWVKVEQAICDIKRAVELTDRSLGGLLIGGRNNAEGLFRGTTETLERRSGSDAIGAQVTYGAKYVEAWGHPEA